MKVIRYLVVRAGGDVRIVTKRPRLRWDEVAFRLEVNIPDTWGEVLGSIELDMPDPPDTPEVQPVEPDDG